MSNAGLKPWIRRRANRSSGGQGVAQARNRNESLATSLVKGRERLRANLKTVADLRGEPEEQTAEQLVINLLRSVPRRIQGYRVDFTEIDVADSGMIAGNPWVRTATGRIFHDHPATAKDALMYVLLRDRVPNKLDVETLVVASQVIRRYIHGADLLPANARVAVDAGCYVGYKAIAYADHIGPEGRVVAIEMMPDNFDLLRRNVEGNGLSEQVATVNCALSDHPGTMMTRRDRKQQATIATDVDQLASFGDECEVKVDTLANVFDRTIPDLDVDFLNVQVNGNELAVLRGLGEWKHRVKSFYVASPYSQSGERIRDQVVDWFHEEGITVTHVGETSVHAERVL